VTSYGDAMRRAGFGTDPAGDARRRKEMAHATITPEELTALRAAEADLAGAPALADHPPVPGHLLTYRRGKAGTEVTCECGRWDGWYNGPRSRRRVLDDHAAHAAAELRAAGPIRVKAERADLGPKELE
jgi:hypothetical protein